MERVLNIFLKNAICTFVLLNFSFFSVLQGKLYANGDYNVENKDALISMAKEIAKKARMEYYDNSDIKIIMEDDFIVVQFIPKPKNIVGGGGAIYFKIENGQYKFIKCVLWQ